MPRKRTTSKSSAASEIQTLKDRLGELERALVGERESNQAVQASLDRHPGTVMVPIKNYSGALVDVPYRVGGQKYSELLDSHGPNQTGAIPLDSWIALERDSRLVRLGYIVRTDRPITNPNVIEDIDAFVRSIREKDIESRVAKIENLDVLYRLSQYIELLPKEEVTGKHLKVLDAVRKGITDKTGVRFGGEE